MTLEEYKALKNEIKKKNDFNIRRPGEGEDPTKWKNTYVLPKKPAEEDEDEEEEDDEEEEEEDEEEIKRKQLLNQIQIKFYEQPSQRGKLEKFNSFFTKISSKIIFERSR
jgi:plasminogen activator inhibitor 1 RNA-binding protein